MARVMQAVPRVEAVTRPRSAIVTSLLVLTILGWALAASPAAAPATANEGAAAAEARAAYKAHDEARLEKAAAAWVAEAPASAEAQLSLGVALIWQNQPERALLPLRRRVALRDDADGRGWLGLALRDAGDFQAGERELRKSLGEQPNSALVQGWLSGDLSFQGRYHEALEAARAALALAPDSASTQEAVGHYTAAAAWVFPPEALSHHGKGRWLLERRRWKEAIAAFDAALAIAPSFADSEYHSAWAYEKLGDRAGAEQRWRRALAGYKPSERVLSTAAQYHLGYSIGINGTPDERKEGMTLLRGALADAASWQVAGYSFALGQVCESVGDLDCTREAFLRFMSGPESVRSQDFPEEKARELARISLGNLGCVSTAGEQERYTPENCPPIDSARHFQAGVLHGIGGRTDEAITEFTAAVAASPRFSLARLSLGQALLSKGRYAEAEVQLRAALDSQGLGLSGGLKKTAKQCLASALVNQEKHPVEAVRLGLAGIEGTASEPATRAWINLTLGRAFAQAGNPRCAAERFNWAAEAKEADEKVRVRAREQLAKLPPDLRAAASRCFEYEKYLEADLPALVNKIISASNGAYGEGKFRLVDVETYRIRAKSEGKRRPLSPSTAFIAKEWAEHMGKDPNHPIVRLYRTEVLVSTGGKEWWLPIQEPLLEAWDQEVKPGSSADLFIWFPGGVSEQLVFMVAEFRACQ